MCLEAVRQKGEKSKKRCDFPNRAVQIEWELCVVGSRAVFQAGSDLNSAVCKDLKQLLRQRSILSYESSEIRLEYCL